VRELTRRTCGRSMTELIEPLRRYMLGWKAYFGLAQTPGVWRRLDEWIRHRLRAIQLKHWKPGTTMYRELLALGASANVARLVAANSRRWWHNSRLALNNIPPITCVDRLACLVSPDLNYSPPPGGDPHAGWCGRGPASDYGRPYVDACSARAMRQAIVATTT
jgi:hypothetical protein